MQTHTFTVEGMHCASCALLIDDALADLPGVHNSQTSLKQQRSVVDLDPRQTPPEQALATIRELGYTAQEA